MWTGYETEETAKKAVTDVVGERESYPATVDAEQARKIRERYRELTETDDE